MQKQQPETRVLGRLGARVITEQEMNLVSGAFNTGLCTFNPTTCAIDNDCSPPPGC